MSGRISIETYGPEASRGPNPSFSSQSLLLPSPDEEKRCNARFGEKYHLLSGDAPVLLRRRIGNIAERRG
jgi:hypothetical protein